MFSTWDFFAIVGVAGQLLVISLLLKGAYRRYPLVLVYCLTRLATTGVEYGFLLRGGLANNRAYSYAYWISDGVLLLLMILMMTVLTLQAMEGAPGRGIVTLVMTASVVLVALVACFLFDEKMLTGRWLTRTSGWLKFDAALLNLFLWSALLRQRSRDVQLLLVSAGLGLEVTGEAIAHSLRVFSNSPSAVLAPNILLIATHLLSLYIWWRAFRLPEPSPKPVPSH